MAHDQAVALAQQKQVDHTNLMWVASVALVH